MVTVIEMGPDGRDIAVWSADAIKITQYNSVECFGATKISFNDSPQDGDDIRYHCINISIPIGNVLMIM
jgi:hypothetical protein